MAVARTRFGAAAPCKSKNKKNLKKINVPNKQH